MDRAYSVFEVKSLNEEQRTIEGIATTPKVDRMGDIVDPMGVTAAATIPLLLYHDSRLPVGTVRFGKPTRAGIPFTATIPLVTEAGLVRDRVEEAWHSVKYKLIAAVSIGFRALEGGIERIDTGLKFLKTEVMELSLVPIPAQDEAVITAFKSFCAGDETNGDATINHIRSIDTELRAAVGREEVGADGEQGKEPVSKPESQAAHVARLIKPARDRAPYVIKRINHLR